MGTRKLRINGIVRTANRIRQALSHALSAGAREQVDVQVSRALGQIDALLRQYSASVGHLPAPSRRAYEYLKRVKSHTADASASAPTPTNAPSTPAPESLRFSGLRSFLTGVLDDLAVGVSANRLNAAATLKVIQATAARLDHAVTGRNIQPGQLKPEARQLLAWFRYFREEAALDRYVAALRRGQRILAPMLARRPSWPPPLLVHYRPSSLMYSIQSHRHGTRLILDTPMITLDEDTMHLLARRILGESRHQKEIMAAMMGGSYQQMRGELAAGAGIVERTGGIAHDLAASFERVNRQYFDGRIPRPDLTWSRTLTGRKFGHYDFVHDRVCISSTLDSPDVPEFVVDHVMHHELLHKKLGLRFQRGRQHAHTPEFRNEERQFARYEEADAFLNRLSANLR